MVNELLIRGIARHKLAFKGPAERRVVASHCTLGGAQISDQLRQMLLCEESEHHELYEEDEKAQLLWRLFEHLALGGACCQFEDVLQAYLDITKRIYKELLRCGWGTAVGWT